MVGIKGKGDYRVIGHRDIASERFCIEARERFSR